MYFDFNIPQSENRNQTNDHDIKLWDKAKSDDFLKNTSIADIEK